MVKTNSFRLLRPEPKAIITIRLQEDCQMPVDSSLTAPVLALFGGLGPWEIALILLAILLLFGGRKLPELARGLGRGLREFKRELKGVKDAVEEDEDQAPTDKESPSGNSPDKTASQDDSDKE